MKNYEQLVAGMRHGLALVQHHDSVVWYSGSRVEPSAANELVASGLLKQTLGNHMGFIRAKDDPVTAGYMLQEYLDKRDGGDNNG